MTDDELGVIARGVTRSFGAVRALSGLDLTAPYGEVTALVGPNGAGKTTLLLILATLLTPDTGEVRVAGCDPVHDPVGVRGRVGWMPDTFGVYDQLTVREYELLLHFMRHPGQVFSRDQLMDAVWRYSFYTDTSTVTVHVRRLRAKIEEEPSRPRWLQTVWGVGYRFQP